MRNGGTFVERFDGKSGRPRKRQSVSRQKQICAHKLLRQRDDRIADEKISYELRRWSCERLLNCDRAMKDFSMGQNDKRGRGQRDAIRDALLGIMQPRDPVLTYSGSRQRELTECQQT